MQVQNAKKITVDPLAIAPAVSYRNPAAVCIISHLHSLQEAPQMVPPKDEGSGRAGGTVAGRSTVASNSNPALREWYNQAVAASSGTTVAACGSTVIIIISISIFYPPKYIRE